ncbi:MAG TPA: glycosyltransferase [Cyclobacteriaceae bacterium]|jgi:cellulose synthase/poly-beta-1,6-N-acetylglucosamine synthase-like glycosyltransferase|nr:glycosyltransferase [Cyclobacteriaceae bacterium]
MTLFLLIVFGIYFLLLLALIVGWEISTKQRTLSNTETNYSITVIVPFRNEAKYLPGIVADLSAQNYLPHAFKVFFIDDHSEDNSIEVLTSCIKGKQNFALISLPEEWEGKKKAIDHGIKEAVSELIVTTDADCKLPEGWLSSIDQAFQNASTKLVFGGVKILSNDSAFSKLQSLEFSSLIGSGAATLGLGFPTMCNGANLAYRKSVYLEVDGFEGNFEIASGDDEFLMRKIFKKYPEGISFLNDRNSVVSTQPQSNLKDFVSQRLRWAGKWKYNQSLASKLLALFVLLFHTTLVVFVALAIAGKVDPVFVVVAISGKVFLEFIFLARVNAFLNQPIRPIYFLALQFIHPLYVIVIGFLSQRGGYSWKGRSLNT